MTDASKMGPHDYAYNVKTGSCSACGMKRADGNHLKASDDFEEEGFEPIEIPGRPRPLRPYDDVKRAKLHRALDRVMDAAPRDRRIPCHRCGSYVGTFVDKDSGGNLREYYRDHGSPRCVEGKDANNGVKAERAVRRTE